MNVNDVRITFVIRCKNEPEYNGHTFPNEVVLARVHSVPRIGEEVVIKGEAYVVTNVRYFVIPSLSVELSLPPEVDLYSKKWHALHFGAVGFR